MAASINGSCVQDPFLALANACRNKLPLYVMSNLPEHTEQPPVSASVSPRLLRLRVKVAEWLSEVPTTIVTPLAKLCTVKEKKYAASFAYRSSSLSKQILVSTTAKLEL